MAALGHSYTTAYDKMYELRIIISEKQHTVYMYAFYSQYVKCAYSIYLQTKTTFNYKKR